MQAFKQGLCNSISVVSTFTPKNIFNLAIEPDKHDDVDMEHLRDLYHSLDERTRHKAEFIYWELSKMNDPTVDGVYYGRDHFFDVPKRTARSLHRVGAFGTQGLVQIECPKRISRSKTTNITSYYSLSERSGREYPMGQVGYVNGMGNTIGWAGRDACKLSDGMCDGVNFHCVYLPSYVISKDNFSPNGGDLVGVMMDVTRHLATNGGENNLTSCLIAQLWIDYLNDNPGRSFLQICASDGGTYVKKAVKMMTMHAPHYLKRISIIGLAPGSVILPNEHLTASQVINLIKKEDILIHKYGTGGDKAGNHPNVVVVPHTGHDHPHNFTNHDYCNAVKIYIESFKKTGKLIPI